MSRKKEWRIKKSGWIDITTDEENIEYLSVAIGSKSQSLSKLLKKIILLRKINIEVIYQKVSYDKETWKEIRAEKKEFRLKDHPIISGKLEGSDDEHILLFKLNKDQSRYFKKDHGLRFEEDFCYFEILITPSEMGTLKKVI